MSFNVRSKYKYKCELQCKIKIKYKLQLRYENKIQLLASATTNSIRNVLKQIQIQIIGNWSDHKNCSRARSWSTSSLVNSTLKFPSNIGGGRNVCGTNVEKERTNCNYKQYLEKITRPPWEDIFWDYHRCDHPYVIIHRYCSLFRPI